MDVNLGVPVLRVLPFPAEETVHFLHKVVPAQCVTLIGKELIYETYCDLWVDVLLIWHYKTYRDRRLRCICLEMVRAGKTEFIYACLTTSVVVYTNTLASSPVDLLNT